MTLTPHPTSTVPTTSVAPSTTDPPTSTGAATPTTSLTLTGDNVASVEAFVYDFFDAYNESKESRDLSVFEAVYLPQCDRCVSMRDELASWLAAGEVEGGDWHVLQTISTAFPDGGRGDFTALAYRDEVSIVAASGSTSSTDGVGIQIVNGVLRPGGDPWMAEGLSFMDPPP